MLKTKDYRSLASYILIAVLPFVMFHWIAPFVSGNTIGNDYTRFPIEHQMELFFSLKTGSFPLFVPGFAGGQSSSTLTLAQVYHPIAFIAAHLPGYWSGHALEWITLLRLLSLAVAQAALFLFLRRLRIGTPFALVLSIVAVYNLQILGVFQYGGSLESWTGHILLFSAIGLYYLRPSRIAGPLSIVAATYWLICSGHPQYVYYCLLGVMFFTLAMPWFAGAVTGSEPVSLNVKARFWAQMLLFCGIGVLLSAAYILPYYFDFILTTTERAGKGYEWACLYTDTLAGTVNNFFYPLRTFVNGNFGGSSLFLAAALVPAALLSRTKIPGVILAAWGVFLLAFFFMQGDRTPVHYIAWKFLPIFSSVRIPGRISVIIPMLLVMILAWLLRPGAFEGGQKPGGISGKPLGILLITSLVLIAAYEIFPFPAMTGALEASPEKIRLIPNWVKPLYAALGALSLSALLLLLYRPKTPYVRYVLVVAACSQLLTVLPYGTWVEPKKDTPSFSRMLENKHASISYYEYVPGLGVCTDAILRQVKESFLEPFLAKAYVDYVTVNSTDEAYEVMAKGRSPFQAVIEQYPPDNVARSAARDDFKAQADLAYSSYNRLVFNVTSSQEGFLVLAYPYTGHWQSTVNGNKAHVYRANGAYNAVRIPSGASKIEFRYWSEAAFLGMIVTCIMIPLMGIFFSFYGKLRLKAKIITIAVTALAGAGVFLLWHNSLYAGDNLDSRYRWVSPSPSQYRNLAYGKRTELSSVYYPDLPYISNGDQAVDGNRTPRSGFISDLQNEHWWTVDLDRIEPIGLIRIFERPATEYTNIRPMTIALSQDKVNWSSIAIRQTLNPFFLEFREPVNARYIRISTSSSDVSYLALDEVEVLPPSAP